MSWGDGDTRTCDRPGCGASYQAFPGPEGQTAERHWLMYPTFSLHLCPDDQHLWRRDKTGPHCPVLDHAARTASCTCGHPLPGPTLGTMADQYIAHLAAVLPPRKAEEDA